MERRRAVTAFTTSLLVLAISEEVWYGVATELQQKPMQGQASDLELYLPFAGALPSRCPQHRRTHTTVQWRTTDTLVLDHPEIEVFPDNAVTTKELIAAECAMICARQCTRNRLLLSMHRFSSMLQDAHHEGQVLTPSTNTDFNITGTLGSKPILGKSAQETQTPHPIRPSITRMRRTTRSYFS